MGKVPEDRDILTTKRMVEALEISLNYHYCYSINSSSRKTCHSRFVNQIVNRSHKNITTVLGDLIFFAKYCHLVINP